ncbi:MAG: ATP-binding cassette domain-containing protein, partial [Betaproteobacteria bacterium]|nr:ATP-binding cassette domain-containing protein [Betaproteobacteria bacterium]
MSARDTILEVRGISLSFGGVQALSEISFDVQRGEIRSIIGPNGAGKSSMLNCINGAYKPQKGEIYFDGQLLGDVNPRRMASLGIAR